jgi:hypothetical protein
VRDGKDAQIGKGEWCMRGRGQRFSTRTGQSGRHTGQEYEDK